MTLGSPLATHVIRRGLRGAGLRGADAYPRNIARWVNLTARGDTTALHPRLEPRFREMVELGLVGSIEDYVDLENCFRAAYGLNAHEAYGYLFQRKRRRDRRRVHRARLRGAADTGRAARSSVTRLLIELRLDDHVDPAVALSALRGVVARDRLRLAIADRAHARAP